MPYNHPDFGKLFPCEKCKGQLAYQAERLRKLTHLTGELRECTLNRWKGVEGLERVMPELTGFLRKNGRGNAKDAAGWIILTGPNGTGKTHLAAALINFFVELGRPALYATSQQILQDLRNTYDPEFGIAYSRLWADVTEHAEVLAIDEFEKINGTPWAIEQLIALIEQRHIRRDKLLTIFATNVDLRSGVEFRITPKGPWPPGYIESRMRDARNLLLDEFWSAVDQRPYMDLIQRYRDEPL